MQDAAVGLRQYARARCQGACVILTFPLSVRWVRATPPQVVPAAFTAHRRYRTSPLPVLWSVKLMSPCRSAVVSSVVHLPSTAFCTSIVSPYRVQMSPLLTQPAHVSTATRPRRPDWRERDGVGGTA